MISVSRARELIRLRAPGPEPESVAIEAAAGRTLAAAVRALGAVPPFAGSAMDGYATAASPAGTRLTVVGESRAGAPWDGRLAAGQAVRVSTGAMVPGDAASVVRQEDVRRLAGAEIELRADLRPGANIRRAGEDMEAGQVVLPAGTVLGPAELAVAVAAGQGSLTVARVPRIRILCTGDELRPAGQPLRPGQIHNSNGPMLQALAQRAGADASPAALVGDDPGATEAALAAALEAAEIVLISGGVSVGPHDHVKPALERLGVEEVFWRVALQPGKPTWFGARDDRLVFGLPGNPASAAVTFALFARVALGALLGRAPSPAPPRARLAEPVRQSPDRMQALRVRLDPASDGTWATPTGPQGSHRTTSLLGADALALIPSGGEVLPRGTTVELEPLAR